MDEEQYALLRIRALRRDGYRCQAKGCGARTAMVGQATGLDGDSINLAALCSFHVAHGCDRRKPRTA